MLKLFVFIFLLLETASLLGQGVKKNSKTFNKKVASLELVRISVTDSLELLRKQKLDSLGLVRKHKLDSLELTQKWKLVSLEIFQKTKLDSIVIKQKKDADSAELAQSANGVTAMQIAIRKADSIKAVEKRRFDSAQLTVRLYFGVTYSPQIAFRRLLVNDPRFTDQSLFDGREQNETPCFSSTISLLPFGVEIGMNHYWYLELVSIRQGFESKRSLINWDSGLPTSSSINSRYSFSYYGGGLGYSYSSNRRAVNLLTDLGFSVLLLNKYKYNENTIKGKDLKSNPLTRNLNRNSCIFKFGMGVNIRDKKQQLSVRLVPTIYYSIFAVSNETLNTKLMNYGLTAGIYWSKIRQVR